MPRPTLAAAPVVPAGPGAWPPFTSTGSKTAASDRAGVGTLAPDVAADRIGRAIWRDIRRGTCVRVPPKEESLTDFALRELLWTARGVWVRPHDDKALETRTGADWEWWLGTPGAWVGYRVQAKRLFGNLRYEEMWRDRRVRGAFTVPRGIDQAERLIDGAAWRRRDPTVPLYMLYNWWTPPRTLPVGTTRSKWWADHRSPCRDVGPFPARQGWLAVNAEVVRDTLVRGPGSLTPWSPGTRRSSRALYFGEFLFGTHTVACLFRQVARWTSGVAAMRGARPGRAQKIPPIACALLTDGIPGTPPPTNADAYVLRGLPPYARAAMRSAPSRHAEVTARVLADHDAAAGALAETPDARVPNDLGGVVVVWLSATDGPHAAAGVSDARRDGGEAAEFRACIPGQQGA